VTRPEAESECRRLAAKSPDADTYRWEPTEVSDDDWQVAKIGPFPPGQSATGTEQRAEHKPPAPEDMRPSLFRNIPPYGPA
jgi:hypothetical protein